ncbi:hypothetical protein [Nocardia miyunensis]|uniref:hypothetical protein n=1 Tax=Nocardia miyunensis TaxID=282684 RepID=UPI00350E50A8
MDNILRECDYPHSDWPNSREFTGKLLQEVSDADAHKVVELNARKLFKFPASTESASTERRIILAHKDIEAADWVDQDLLTRREAGERLAEEIVGRPQWNRIAIRSGIRQQRSVEVQLFIYTID